jgi:hypothetical protein
MEGVGSARWHIKARQDTAFYSFMKARSRLGWLGRQLIAFTTLASATLRHSIPFPTYLDNSQALPHPISNYAYARTSVFVG